MAFFEAPHKLQKTLAELSLLVNRPIIIARELTKLHEEFVTGSPTDLLARFDAPQGEFTIILPPVDPSLEPKTAVADSQVIELFGQITELKPGGTKRDVARETGERLGLSAKQVYDIIERNKLVK